MQAIQLLQEHFEATPASDRSSHTAAYAGTTHRHLGLKTATRNRITQQWLKAQEPLTFEKWWSLVDGLYSGDSYEGKCAAATLLAKYPRFRSEVSFDSLAMWLGQLTGWAEVDTTCSGVFTANEMLANWPSWNAFLRIMTAQKNIHQRRASLVLLVTPLITSNNPNFLRVALANCNRLKAEQEILITKAISWVLRHGIKYHRAAIEEYLEANAETLPAIAVRETRKKLHTGKK